MKCAACDMENPADRELCYRCSHPLDLSQITVVPPRQTPFGKLMWTVLPVGRIRFLEQLRERVASNPYLVWFLSIIPGLGHAILSRRMFAAGLFVTWFVLSLGESGELSFRPRTWVMMVQCFAMADAFLKARDKKDHWAFGIFVNLVTAAVLAVTEMYIIGGILS